MTITKVLITVNRNSGIRQFCSSGSWLTRPGAKARTSASPGYRQSGVLLDPADRALKALPNDLLSRHPFQVRPVPATRFCSRFVGTLKESEQFLIRVVRPANRIVR